MSNEQSPTESRSEPEAGTPPRTPQYCGYTTFRHGSESSTLPATGNGTTGTEKNIFDELARVEDPEMPISVVDLGLIYDVTVRDGHATITMTLTYTGCPARDYLQEDIRRTAEQADGVSTVDVRLVWSPEWTIELVTDRGKEQLREFGVSI